jgi:hypothetical protein
VNRSDDYYGSGSLGPLFEQPDPGPFVKSQQEPTTLESLIAEMIYRRKGRTKPISIAEIILDGALDHLSIRTVKDIVHHLRLAHRMPIGSSRQEPYGYYWIVDKEDLEAAVRPYKNQIKKMLAVWRVLEGRERVQEFLGQLRFED